MPWQLLCFICALLLSTCQPCGQFTQKQIKFNATRLCITKKYLNKKCKGFQDSCSFYSLPDRIFLGRHYETYVCQSTCIPMDNSSNSISASNNFNTSNASSSQNNQKIDVGQSLKMIGIVAGTTIGLGLICGCICAIGNPKDNEAFCIGFLLGCFFPCLIFKVCCMSKTAEQIADKSCQLKEITDCICKCFRNEREQKYISRQPLPQKKKRANISLSELNN